MYILLAILLIGILIIVHEFGHFIVAKKCGVTVLEFSIGFGPKLVKWERNGTKYSVRLLPLGGFVQFLGEDEDSKEPGAFNNISAWKRFLTVFSGPFFNIILAVVLAFFFIVGFGYDMPQITGFAQGMPAQESGLMEGDIILAVDGKTVDFQSDASTYIAQSTGDHITLTILRGEEELEFEVAPELVNGERMVGIYIGSTSVRIGFFESIGKAFTWVWNIVVEMLKFLFNLITGQAVEGGIVGPVGTISLIGEAARYGLRTILMMAAMLSVNLGIVNLLPIPALDGGRLIFLIAEMIRRKPIPQEMEGKIHFAGFVLLMGLILFLTYQDVLGLFGG